MGKTPSQQGPDGVYRDCPCLSPGALLTGTLGVAGHGGSWGPHSSPDGGDGGWVGLSRLQTRHKHTPFTGGSVLGALLPAHLQLKGLIASQGAGPGQEDPIPPRGADA